MISAAFYCSIATPFRIVLVIILYVVFDWVPKAPYQISTPLLRIYLKTVTTKAPSSYRPAGTKYMYLHMHYVLFE
jgi:hypothetical protein